MARRRAESEELRDYVEEIALFFEMGGMPRMAGRIFGWLLVSEEPCQTLDELAAATRGSKGSMSTMTRLLARLKLVERKRVPGARRDAWYIRPDAWTASLEEQVRLCRWGVEIADKGLRLLGRSAAGRARLEGFRKGHAWLVEEMPRALERWKREWGGDAPGAVRAPARERKVP